MCVCVSVRVLWCINVINKHLYLHKYGLYVPLLIIRECKDTQMLSKRNNYDHVNTNILCGTISINSKLNLYHNS